jgi:hypothetical protein
MAQQGQAKRAWQQAVLPKPIRVIRDEILHLPSVQTAADRATEAAIRQQKGKGDTRHRRDRLLQNAQLTVQMAGEPLLEQQ